MKSHLIGVSSLRQIEMRFWHNIFSPYELFSLSTLPSGYKQSGPGLNRFGVALETDALPVANDWLNQNRNGRFNFLMGFVGRLGYCFEKVEL